MIGRLALAGWSLCLTGHLVFAQAFPVKPIRLIAPFSAGGGADTVARLVAQKLSELLAQQVIVDNRPGASNVIGTELTARAAPGPIIASLNQAVIKALQLKDVQTRLASEAAEPVGSTPDQFGEYLKQQVERYAKLVRELKLQVD